MVKIEVYKDKKGELRWRAKSRGKTLADSGEGYKRRAALDRALERLFGSTQSYEITGP